MENVQNFIRDERERAGLSLTELSAKTGIPISTLSRYQNGSDVPSSALQKIADELQVPMSALLQQRQIAEGDKLTYEQLNLQLQAAQQRSIMDAVRYDNLKNSHRWSLTVIFILAVFLAYILIDRFVFPNGGIFRAGAIQITASARL